MDICSGQEDLKYGSLSDSDSDSDSDSNFDSDKEDDSTESEKVSENDSEDLEIREDYGYFSHNSDLEEPEVDLNADDDLEYTNLQGFDSLGAEDGINVADPLEDLGFAEL